MRLKYKLTERAFAVLMSFLMVFAAIGFISLPSVDAATLPTATGYIDSSNGAYIRKSASTSSGKVAAFKDRTKLTIIREVFTSTTSTSDTSKWYQVTASGKSGYIRGDLVSDISYPQVTSAITGRANYRKGPGIKMSVKGSYRKGATVNVCMASTPVSSVQGSSSTWYKIKTGSGYSYIASTYISLGSVSSESPSTSSANQTNISSIKAQVNSSEGAFVRQRPSTSSPKVTALNDNAGISIKKEVFTSSSDSSVSSRWYLIEVSGKSGYIRADIVDNISYANVKANVTDELNYRIGAGTGMKKVGSVQSGTSVTLLMEATPSNMVDKWYKAKVGGGTYYISGDYVNITGGNNNSGQSQSEYESAVSKALTGHEQSGGSANNVYTFNAGNCRKLFDITGYKGYNIPQGMAYTGSEYYFLFGNSKQRIVTYSLSGKRLSASVFSFNMGKPNGMTWNPKTGLCYMLKGNQKKIFTWNPKTNKYGTAYTPYSSSGIGYDPITEKIYASSLTGIRVYSSDGNFRHEKKFSRCTHSDTCYVQDCCAYNGIVIHGVTGKNSQGINYLDFYRASNGKYLGSVKVTLGEIESCIVDNDGYLQLLIYNSSSTSYMWKTPLNVKAL